MIDTKIGTVLLDARDAITPSLTLDAFLSSALGRGAQSCGVAVDWPWFSIGQHEVFGDPCMITLSFHKQTLTTVSLFVVGLDDGAGGDYDVDATIALNARFEAWLAAKLGPPPHTYPWGNIAAVYDPRSVSTAVFVAYSRKT